MCLKYLASVDFPGEVELDGVAVSPSEAKPPGRLHKVRLLRNLLAQVSMEIAADGNYDLRRSGVLR